MTTETCESTTGEWLRSLSKVVDSKDKQIAEQQHVINKMTQNRVVVGWFHPQTKRFCYADSKEHALKSVGSKTFHEHRSYTVPVFIDLEKPND